MKYILIRWVL